MLPAMMFAKQTILDLRRGHAHQRPRMRLARNAVGGRVENAAQRPVRREHGRGGAGEIVEAGKEMFAPHGPSPRRFKMRHAAQPIGAAHRFLPDRARRMLASSDTDLKLLSDTTSSNKPSGEAKAIMKLVPAICMIQRVAISPNASPRTQQVDAAARCLIQRGAMPTISDSGGGRASDPVGDAAQAAVPKSRAQGKRAPGTPTRSRRDARVLRGPSRTASVQRPQLRFPAVRWQHRRSTASGSPVVGLMAATIDETPELPTPCYLHRTVPRRNTFAAKYWSPMER